MKKLQKHISMLLALLLTVSVLPASVLTSAAAEAYQLLFEPSGQVGEGVICNGYGDLGVAVVGEDVYYIVRFTGSGIERLPGTYRQYPQLGVGYAAVANASGDMGVIDKNGKTVVDFSYDIIYLSDDAATARAEKVEGDVWHYYQLDLKTGAATEVTEAQYYAGDNGIVADYNSETHLYSYVDAGGKVLFGGYDYASNFHNGYACVAIGDIYQVIDTAGNVVLSDVDKDYRISGSAYTSAAQGLIRVTDRDRVREGYVDLSGKPVIAVQYSWIGDLCNGYITAMNWNGDKITDVTLYDAKGGVAIPAGQYTWMSNVSPDKTLWATSDNGAKSAILKLGGGSAPVTPAGVQAMPTNDTLKVNGEVKNATVYKIDGSNYFKIRDLAAVLNSTSKQFAVGYDGATNSVTATTGQPYQLAGGELAGAAPSAQTATVSNDTIIVNGSVAENVTVYKIDGSNYFKLRDLGSALGFDVGWSQEEGMFINTEG